MSLKVKGTV